MSESDVRAAFEAAETILPPVNDPFPVTSAAEDPDSGRQFDPDCTGEDVPPPLTAFDDATLIEGAAYPLNDYGNGQRLITYYGENIRFVPRLGWYRWDARRWLPDEDELDVRRDAQKIGGLINRELPFLALPDWQRGSLDAWRACRADFKRLQDMDAGDRSDEEKERLSKLRPIAASGAEAEKALTEMKKGHRSHARASGNSSRISSMLLEARTSVVIPIASLNADPLEVNCQNGVLRFTRAVDPLDASFGDDRPKWRVDLVDHHRDQMISKMCEAEYLPEAEAPHFHKFLERVQPDWEMRAFLQRWFGYCLTGLTYEQKLAFFFGSGSNGKSTIVEIMARIAADYGTTIPIESLVGAEQRKGSDATPDLVRLPGARFVRASEPEKDKLMKESLIKILTGGEAIMIRRMQQEFVEITPEFKLTISGNHKPEIRGGDDGIWRRVMLVNFSEQIADKDKDRSLPEKLWAERAGIFAWMVEGCLAFLEGGLQEPEAVLAATAEYRRENDTFGTFLREECTITGNVEDFVTGRDIGDAFNAWRLANSLDAFGKRRCSNEFAKLANVEKGLAADGETEVFYSKHKKSDSGYKGIIISEEAMNRIAKYGDELRAVSAFRR